jgi:hypothetical protein
MYHKGIFKKEENFRQEKCRYFSEQCTKFASGEVRRRKLKTIKFEKYGQMI